MQQSHYTSEAAAINSPACGIIGHNSNFDVLYDDVMNLQNYSIDSNRLCPHDCVNSDKL